MAFAKRAPEFDIDAFLAWEETQEERHEYIHGEVFAMSGGTDAHYTILGNLFTLTKAALRQGPCRAFISGMKMEIKVEDAEGLWVLHPLGAGDVVQLESLDVTFPMHDLYEDVAFAVSTDQLQCA